MRTVQRGMTLIELLVAIAIVALLLMFGGPSAMTWLQNLELRNAADSVLSGIKQARYEAIKRNTYVAFELTDPNSANWHICLYDVPSQACTGTDITTGNAEASQNARVGAELIFTAYSNALDGGSGLPALVAFDSLGRVAAASPANIARLDMRNPSLTTGERRLEIKIDTSGSIRMCDPALSLATNPQGCQ